MLMTCFSSPLTVGKKLGEAKCWLHDQFNNHPSLCRAADLINSPKGHRDVCEFVCVSVSGGSLNYRCSLAFPVLTLIVFAALLSNLC